MVPTVAALVHVKLFNVEAPVVDKVPVVNICVPGLYVNCEFVRSVIGPFNTSENVRFLDPASLVLCTSVVS